MPRRPDLNCNVCGGKEFNLDAGFYFCMECQTQSQDVREVVFDEYFGNQKATKRVLQRKATKQPTVDLHDRLTSWEALNYILKGITDQLIEFGATKKLKIVTLQLWASYLRKLDVAFTSVEIERKPKLGIAFKRSDAEIVYGVTEKQLREKSWRSRSRSTSASRISSDASDQLSVNDSDKLHSKKSLMLKLSKRKKALASAEYSQTSLGSSLAHSQTLESLNLSGGTEKPKRLKITKRAKELLTSSCASSTDDEQSERKQLLKNECRSVHNITVAKISALSNIALALTDRKIQISDFLRWSKEGHIFLDCAQKYLPEGVRLGTQVQRMLEAGGLSYMTCQTLMYQLCAELEIPALPLPDLQSLAERYSLELQLPTDLGSLVSRILNLTTTKDNGHIPSSSKCPEAKAMAAIIVALKTLFSLDDSTEYRVSETATQLNRIEGVKCFVWTDWVKFVECRKAVVSTYHLPTRIAVYGNSVGRDPKLFINHHKQFMYSQKPELREISNRYVLDHMWVDAMTRCLSKLRDLQPQSNDPEPIQFPPSLTPLHSYCKLLLTEHRERVVAALHILDQQFTDYSLEYILSPDQIVALALSNDINVEQKPEGAAADFKIEKMKTHHEFSSVVPKYKINHTNISVGVVEKLINSNVKTDENYLKSDDNTIKSLYREAKDIISDDSDDEDDVYDEEDGMCQITRVPTCHTELELFDTGSQYWCIHINLGKNIMSNDEFDLFAAKNFPSTFLWLLKECSRMINVPMKVLYTHIVNTEVNIDSRLNSNNNRRKKRKL